MTRAKMLRYASICVMFLMVLVPAVMGQSAISGTVKDASGAVMASVAVEASSPALIEQSRTVTTDGAGRFSIVDLRPGTYTVTVSAAGFKKFLQEGIDVPAG